MAMDDIVPVLSFLFSMGYAIGAANPIREYDRVDVTSCVVCCHPYRCFDPRQDLRKMNSIANNV